MVSAYKIDMNRVLIVGAGKIGSLIANFLHETGDYTVHLIDSRLDGPDIKKVFLNHPSIHASVLDILSEDDFKNYIRAHEIQSVVSCLPYYHNAYLANMACVLNIHYFDLTEDLKAAESIKQLAKNATSILVPQCGLAPGFISIVANNLAKKFDTVKSLKLRVGALPQRTNNALNYALTWSTDGLINEYGNACRVIENGELIMVHPLEGIEEIMLDGVRYESFHTSGGLGRMFELYQGKIENLDYKTIRYPGHAEKMHFLMYGLGLNDNRGILKTVLEHALPKTYQDVVLIYVTATGVINGELVEQSYLKKIYPQTIADHTWSAIQVATASSLCAVFDILMTNPNKAKGLVVQESIDFNAFIANRFGKYYAD